MNNWKIATANTRGANNPEKQQDIIKWHLENQHTISIITETRLKPNTTVFLKKAHPEVLQLHTTDPNNPNGSGAAIIINRILTPHIHQITEIPGRCITIQLKFTGKITFTITGIYHQANKDKNTAHQIIKHLEGAHQHSTHSIIAGDLNEPITKPKHLLKWLSKMKYINIAKIFKQTNTPTWSNGITQSTIDFIWTSHNLAKHTNHLNIHFTSEHFETDHKAITIQVNVTSITKANHQKLNKKRQKIFNLSNLTTETWTKWQEAVSEQIIQHPNNNQSHKTLNQNWQYIHNLINIMAKKSFKQKEIPRREHRHSYEESDHFKAKKAISQFIKDPNHYHKTIQKIIKTHSTEAKEILNSPTLLQVDKAKEIRKAIRKARYTASRIKQQQQIQEVIENRATKVETNKRSTLTSVLNCHSKNIEIAHVANQNDSSTE